MFPRRNKKDQSLKHEKSQENFRILHHTCFRDKIAAQSLKNQAC